MKKVIYLDNAATTKVRPEVVEAMLPFYTEYYGNPSAVYEFSTPCKEALAKARETQILSAQRTMRSTLQTAVPSPTTGL